MTDQLISFYANGTDLATDLAARETDPADHWTQSRITIDVYHPKRLRLRVAEVIDETPTTKTFRLVRPDGAALPPFLAGQYIALFSDETSRPYAISSPPTDRSHYDLTVRRVPGGRISNRLADTLHVGDECVTTGPLGTCHHNPLFHGDDVVFLAGGSGVAPAMSMIREIAEAGLDRRLHLIYGSRSADDVIFENDLARIATEHEAITVSHVIGDLLSAETITALAGPLNRRMVYVCGPQALYPYALEQLAQLAHPRHRIRFEANGAPSRPDSQPHWPPSMDPAGQVSVTVGERSFRTSRGRPLLDALEDNGIRPESACRSGECSLCRIRVLAGDVHQAQEATPRSCDARFGYVHACVSYPLTDVTLEV